MTIFLRGRRQKVNIPRDNGKWKGGERKEEDESATVRVHSRGQNAKP